MFSLRFVVLFLDSEDKGTTTLQNVGWYYHPMIVSHLRTLDSYVLLN